MQQTRKGPPPKGRSFGSTESLNLFCILTGRRALTSSAQATRPGPFEQRSPWLRSYGLHFPTLHPALSSVGAAQADTCQPHQALVLLQFRDASRKQRAMTEILLNQPHKAALPLAKLPTPPRTDSCIGCKSHRFWPQGFPPGHPWPGTRRCPSRSPGSCSAGSLRRKRPRLPRRWSSFRAGP